MLEKLKEEVCKASLNQVKLSLVIFTLGNVSGTDRKQGLVAIKPSGISCDVMKSNDMVIPDWEGNVTEGSLNPPVDAPIHPGQYRNFKNIGDIVHTHSEWTTNWTLGDCGIPAAGATHADYFYGEIPCACQMTKAETKGEYELETGKLIVETCKGPDPDLIPGVQVNNQALLGWGKNADSAVFKAAVLDEVAKMTFRSFVLNSATPTDQVLFPSETWKR